MSSGRPGTLLDDYNSVLLLANELRVAVRGLVGRIAQVCRPDDPTDSIHARLVDVIGGKVEKISRSLKSSRKKPKTGTVGHGMPASVSLFSQKTKRCPLTITNSVATSVSSLLIAQYKTQVDLTCDDSFDDLGKKRSMCLSLAWECGSTDSTPPAELPASLQHLPLLTDPTPRPVGRKGHLSSKNTSNAHKTNFFDVIADLARLNFVDREQVRVLKRLVVRREARVLAPLQRYRDNGDLQVLIGSIGSLMEQ